MILHITFIYEFYVESQSTIFANYVDWAFFYAYTKNWTFLKH